MAGGSYALTGVAALTGAVGVIEAAAAAHGHVSPLLSTASQFLIVNAAASIALAGFAVSATRGRGWLLAAAAVLLCGGMLFCADLTIRAYGGSRLFPFAAPIGGSLMICGWLLAGVSAFGCCLLRRPHR